MAGYQLASRTSATPFSASASVRTVAAAVAECVRSFHPKVVYPYHYDQAYIARLAGRGDASSATTAAASVRTLADELKGVAEVRSADWYPAK